MCCSPSCTVATVCSSHACARASVCHRHLCAITTTFNTKYNKHAKENIKINYLSIVKLQVISILFLLLYIFNVVSKGCRHLIQKLLFLKAFLFFIHNIWGIMVGVTDSCESPFMGPGNRTQFLCKSNTCSELQAPF